MPYNTLPVRSYQVAYTAACDYKKDQYIQIDLAEDAQDFDTLDGGEC